MQHVGIVWFFAKCPPLIVKRVKPIERHVFNSESFPVIYVADYAVSTHA